MLVCGVEGLELMGKVIELESQLGLSNGSRQYICYPKVFPHIAFFGLDPLHLIQDTRQNLL